MINGIQISISICVSGDNLMSPIFPNERVTDNDENRLTDADDERITD
jgi:hypothetical protein